jgi:hypothetical protein
MNKQDLQASLTKKAMSQFESKFRNVLALLRDISVADLWKRMGAVIELDPEMTGVLESRSGIIDQKNDYARGVAQDDFVKDLFVMACRAFHTLQERGVITFATRLTFEAETELQNLEIIIGLQPPRPILPPAKTAAEILEDTVTDDFAHLPGDKFRLKLNGNTEYRRMYEHLAQTGKLTSRTTTAYSGDEVGQ